MCPCLLVVFTHAGLILAGDTLLSGNYDMMGRNVVVLSWIWIYAFCDESTFVSWGVHTPTIMNPFVNTPTRALRKIQEVLVSDRAEGW